MKSAKILRRDTAAMQTIEPLKSKLKLICSDKIHIISKSDILFLKSDSNYCEVFLADGTSIYCSQTLKSIASRLHSSQFFRCHQSYVFNMRFIESVNSNMQELTLEGDRKIPVSRSNRSALKALLENWFD